MKIFHLTLLLVAVTLMMSCAAPSPSPTPSPTPAAIPSPAPMLAIYVKDWKIVPIEELPLEGVTPPSLVFSPNWSERRGYSPFGMQITLAVGKEITNMGGPADVYVTVVWEAGDLTYSKVFHLDAGETVKIWALYDMFISNYSVKLKFAARPASVSDASQGEIEIERLR